MSLKKIVILIMTLLLLGAGTAVFMHYRGHGVAAVQQKEIYHCPMHPNYTSDRPGDCPICGMHLVKTEAPPQNATAVAERKIKFYRSPMNPGVTSKVPMKDEMGMDYVPVYESEGAEVGGRAPINIGSGKTQLIGVKTAVAAYRDLTHAILSSGKVAYDPELYQAISEYREALTAADKVKNSTWPDVIERAEGLAAASRLRLRQMGLSQEQIQEIGKTDGAQTNLLLPESKAWIYAQIYEYEAGLVKAGQRIEATAPAYPGKTFYGEVKAVDSVVSSETRTLKLRAEVENPGAMLKPDMYVDVKIKVGLGSRLSVPFNAIVSTGIRKLVFVDKGEGSFEPREVKTGEEAGDYVEIISGVRAGEKVVTSANFLIDSESRMKSSVTE
jgi:Cu(I)/Ag(I) efflux system membrane fusion protein